MSSYNKTTMSGFVPANSIMAGRLQDNKTPLVRFQVISGNQPHSVFILKVKLAVEMYAWYVSMARYRTEKVYVAATASIVSSGHTSILVADNIDFNTSNPELRVEVQRCTLEMLSGNAQHEWPERVVKIPIKALPKSEMGK